ncbi:YhcN/YlaJ family sporulation lipoprotein [Virgibacillus sp. NKC19-3]|uniref:YhcN/YlaJ family sporulation lipoprotein n=1 Tax=Virgibacillus saliphilus TaxID=2831674 RepID=UPI001C9A94E7|nr:YhcN/YlaJ family sporulation lipoprotein [Virgibacillus sp. NKC19-3]MBY7143990.1 YhcN/YlaJ family sporulation lipoprotein [Virgibacillus sp. NKC19-3]
MYPKLFIPIVLIALFALTGCGSTDNAGDDPNDAEPLNPTREQQQAPVDEELDEKLGYVRYTNDQVDNDQEGNRNITIDRNEMANMITRVILRNDGFEEVATLVTDGEVLIAYEKEQDMDGATAADIAKKTAMSIMPRFFEIYVSENEVLMEDIESLSNSTTENRNYDNTIDRIIEEMKKSPQGNE